jgi:hypothetical protein
VRSVAWCSGASRGASLPEVGPESSLAFWIKRVEGLQERTLDAVLARNGLRRRHWQLLEALGVEPLTRAQITEALLPFWVAASVTQTDSVDDLVRRDWAATDGSTYRLTEDGAAARARIAEQVRGADTDSLRGVGAAELRTVREVLAQVARNLAAVLDP